MSERQAIVSVAERVIDADPTRVWALLANPERIADWAAVRVVGYMGTELPQAGHSVFLQHRFRRGRPTRVEIESFDPGAGIKCLAHTEPEPTRFELSIHPEVQHESITTRVRLTQRSRVPRYVQAAARWWVGRQLNSKLDRIEKVCKT